MRKRYRETETHIYFWGSFLSNYWTHERMIVYDGHVFNSSEHLFMYLKALHFNDLVAAERITKAIKPSKAKRIGRQVVGFDDEEWNKVKYEIMLKTLRAKFENKGFRKLLAHTKDKILVEGGPYDTIWGVGLHYSDDLILNESNWRGENLLGKALMEIREEIKQEGKE